MSLLNSSNPMLKDEVFNGHTRSTTNAYQAMTVKGAMQKFGVLMLLMLATSIASWKYAAAGNNSLPLIITSIIGCLVVSFTMSRKPEWSTFLAPIGAILEGLFVGTVSAFYEYAVGAAGGYSGIVAQAAGLTMCVGLALFALYYYRIINVTQRFKSIVLTACTGVAMFYLVVFVCYLIFGQNAIPGFIYQPTLFGIGFSILMVGLAAMKLLVDFDTIEEAAAAGSPSYFEWYCSYSLLVTLVWLYIEILRLLAKLAARD